MKKNDVVQFTEGHKWCGCLGIISGDKGKPHPRRYIIGVPVPSNDGKPQTAYIFDDGSKSSCRHALWVDWFIFRFWNKDW